MAERIELTQEHADLLEEVAHGVFFNVNDTGIHRKDLCGIAFGEKGIYLVAPGQLDSYRYLLGHNAFLTGDAALTAFTKKQSDMTQQALAAVGRAK